jgi:GxGYxYP putative glycoside hydrolase C-terminal domain/GxGYxY sequence motif in domain of unknown function N-terminal
MHNNTEISNSSWSSNGLLPAFQAPEHLDVYDIRNASHAIQLSVTTITGLINRQRPKVYLLSKSDDAFWHNQVFAHIPHDISAARDEAVLETLLNDYRNRVAGLIIYDPGFIDSVNVATTLAGQKDCIVVSPALAETLQGPPHRLPVVADLRIYQWKSRVQAYLWAERNLLKNATPGLVAGLDPKIPGALRSFLVATRTFVYWLDARDILPDIRNGWIAERSLMKRILKAFAPGTIHLGWYVNEALGVRLTSGTALSMLATDYFCNLEVWTSIQNVGAGLAPALPEAPALPTAMPEAPAMSDTPTILDVAARPAVPAQPEAPTKLETAGMPDTPALLETPALPTAMPDTLTMPAAMPEATALPPKAYVSFTISDGDNLQYNQHRMAQLWQDPVRGTIPIGWTISPTLVRVAPALAAYYTRTATPNDELVAGPSGAGYMLPSCWPAAYLPAFLQRTGQLMQAMNLDVIEVLDTGLLFSQAFINQNLQQKFVKVLAPFGIRGVLSGSGQTHSSWKNISSVPIIQNLGPAGSVDKAVNLVRNATLRAGNSQFLNVYIIAWTMTPSDLKQVIQQLGNEYEVVTPGKLLAMIASAFSFAGK